MQTLSDFQNSGLSIQDLAQHLDDLACAISELKTGIANGEYTATASNVLALMEDAHKNGHKHFCALWGYDET